MVSVTLFFEPVATPAMIGTSRWILDQGLQIGRSFSSGKRIEELDLNNAALQRYGHSVGSIVRAKLRQNLPHVCLNRFLRNFEVVGNDLVRVAGSYLPQDVDFSVGQRIIGMMFCQFHGDFRRNSPSPAVHHSNRLNQFFPQHALQKIAVSACFERSVSLA